MISFSNFLKLGGSRSYLSTHTPTDIHFLSVNVLTINWNMPSYIDIFTIELESKFDI